MFEVIIITSVLTILFIGLSAFRENPKSATNRLVAALCGSWIVWTLLTYISLHFDFYRLYVVRATMIFVMIMLGLFFFFMRVFPRTSYRLTRFDWIYLWCTIGAVFVGATPLLFEGIIVSPAGDISPVPGPGIPIFMLYALSAIIGSVVVLVRKIYQSDGLGRQQLRLIVLGALVFFIVMPLTNFVLPVVFSISSLVTFSPIAPMFFAICIGYAIIRHQLFDIRRFVVRGVVYLLILALLSTLYVMVVINTGSNILRSQGLGSYQNAFYVAATLLIAISFHPLRLYVNRLSNKYFFQDIYDTKTTIDEISSTLVRTTDVEVMLKKTLKILKKSLSVNTAAAVVGDIQHEGRWRVINADQKIQGLEVLIAEQQHQSKRLVIFDEIDERAGSLYASMRDSDVKVVVRLEALRQPVGYLFFGYKANGNLYNSQDIELIKIASESLAVAIQNALRFEEIEHFNERLQQEIKTATTKLRMSNLKLHHLDESKDEFISMASHQLRTPLTSIKGYISMLLDGDLGELKPAQKQALEQAYDSSQRMVYLIGDFLNLSRIQTGRFELEKTNVSLPKILAEEIDQLRQSAKSRNIILLYDAPKDFPLIEADETKLRQVMMNFIDNAIYYAKPESGEILVILERRRDEIVFTVKDNGIGVPVHERKHLFSKFYRAGNARKARPDGTGIGLFMAKRVVIAHGGTILFESKEGEGSEFGFRLPLVSDNT